MAMVASAPPQLRPYDRDAQESAVTYEDQIVPALRRRLAQESKELSKRMSAHMAPSFDYTTSAPSEVSDDGNRPLPVRTQSPPAAPVNRRNGEGSASDVPPINRTRKRTYSTPFAFEPPADVSRRQNRAPVAAAAMLPPDPPVRSVSSGVMRTVPTALPATPRSRIPKPSTRARSVSKSSRNAPGPTKSSASLSSDHNQPESVHHQSRPDSPLHDYYKSSNGFEPLNDEQLEQMAARARALHESENEPPAPEPTFEHWYRGEGIGGGGRNGGRGEIRAGTQEMLAIALGGHAAVDYSRDSWNSRGGSGAHYEDGDFSDSQRGDRWRGDSQAWTEDYVLDERMLTDMEQTDGNATDAETFDVPSTPATPAQPLPNAQPPKTPQNQRRAPTPSSQTTQTQTTPTQNRSKSATHNKPTANGHSHPPASTSTPLPAKLSASTNTPTPGRGHPQQRVRRKTSFPPASGPSGSRSAYDLSSVNASPFAADAVPPINTPPPMPASGNWDEVVLPTLAKKMRATKPEEDITMLGGNEYRGNNKRNSKRGSMIVPPAPGTFGYDASKAYRERDRGRETTSMEMGQFGVTEERAEPGPEIAIDNDPKSARPMSFQAPQPSQEVLQPPRIPLTETASGGNMSAKELRKNKPAIRVISPSIDSRGQQRRPAQHDDDDDVAEGGCCRCVVM